jgi:hypothetical protein
VKLLTFVVLACGASLHNFTHHHARAGAKKSTCRQCRVFLEPSWPMPCATLKMAGREGDPGETC